MRNPDDQMFVVGTEGGTRFKELAEVIWGFVPKSRRHDAKHLWRRRINETIRYEYDPLQQFKHEYEDLMMNREEKRIDHIVSVTERTRIKKTRRLCRQRQQKVTAKEDEKFFLLDSASALPLFKLVWLIAKHNNMEHPCGENSTFWIYVLCLKPRINNTETTSCENHMQICCLACLFLTLN